MKRAAWPALALALLLSAGIVDQAPADPLPAPTVYDLIGAAAEPVRREIGRLQGLTLPRCSIQIITVPNSDTALFWVYIGRDPVMAGYVRLDAIKGFLGQPA